MPYIQIKNISDEAYNLLKQKAITEKRSIQQEAAWLLEQALMNQPFSNKQDSMQSATKVREEMLKYHTTLKDSTGEIREKISEYASNAAGTTDDLDPGLEEAGIESISLTAEKKRKGK